MTTGQLTPELRELMDTPRHIAPKNVADALQAIGEQAAKVNSMAAQTVAESAKLMQMVSDYNFERKSTKTSIMTMGFSVRSTNSLIADGIVTVEELLQKKKTDLLALPNLGRKSFNDILEILGHEGLLAGTPLGQSGMDAFIEADAKRRAATATQSDT